MPRARSLTEFQQAFPDEGRCAAFLFERRWLISFETLLGLASHRSPLNYWDIAGRENPRKGAIAVRTTPRRRKTAAGMRQDGALKPGEPPSNRPAGPGPGLKIDEPGTTG